MTYIAAGILLEFGLLSHVPFPFFEFQSKGSLILLAYGRETPKNNEEKKSSLKKINQLVQGSEMNA